MILLRSVLFAAIQAAMTVVFSCLVLLAFPLAPIPRYRLIAQWARFITWLSGWLLGIRYRVEGLEHLPERPAVVLAKHQSAWETIAFQLIFPPLSFVLKRELLRIPFFGWGLALTSPIAIDRNAGRDALRQIEEQGRQRMAQGFWVLVFPEGTRVRPGERGRYQIGGAWLAARTGAPVVPVAHNAGELWPKNAFLKRPGTVTVRTTLTGRNLPRPLVRENVFLSTQDIALYVPWEMALIADVLAYNEFADPGLLTVTLDAMVQPGFAATEVVALHTDRDAYAPGDRVRFAVTLRGWRGQLETWDGWVEIPDGIDTPYVELRAYGGPRQREKGEPARTLESLADLLDFIDGIPTYDTLTVELFALDPISSVIGQTWLYGVDGVADRIPDTVVYGEAVVILPVREKQEK